MQLGFVFVNYNGSSDSIAAVRSLQQSDRFETFRIVIVDNASADEHINAINAALGNLSNVHLYRSNQNLGYFPALNAGIEYLRANHPEADHLIIGNNDLLFAPDFYQQLEKKADVLAICPVVSPDVVTEGGVHQNPHVISKISPLREIVYDFYHSSYLAAKLVTGMAKLTHKFTDRKDEEQHDVAQYIYQGHGSVYILTPLFFQHWKKLWAPTFLMSEEFFLAVQLMQKDMRVYYEPAIQVVHRCHASMGKLPGKKVWGFSQTAHREYRRHVDIWGKITVPKETLGQ